MKGPCDTGEDWAVSCMTTESGVLTFLPFSARPSVKKVVLFRSLLARWKYEVLFRSLLARLKYDVLFRSLLARWKYDVLFRSLFARLKYVILFRSLFARLTPAYQVSVVFLCVID